MTNPRAPRILKQGVGDTGADDGTLEGVNATPNSSHSTFMWQGNDRRAYVVFVDNTEFFDVDIFEITDPANPRPVAEYDFVALAADQGVDIVDQGGLGGAADIFLHDMVVKKIGDRFIMMADYWDAGYLTFDVTNPAAPRYIGDSTFDGPDPLTGQDAAGGQRPPGRVLARQPVHPGCRRGLQPVPARRVRDHDRPRRGRVRLCLGRRRRRGVVPARSEDERPDRLRRLRLRRLGSDPAARDRGPTAP